MRCLCEGSAAYESGNSGPSGYGMSGPGGLEGRTCAFDGCVGVGDGDVGTACAMPIPNRGFAPARRGMPLVTVVLGAPVGG
jgi:hypothetical protein